MKYEPKYNVVEELAENRQIVEISPLERGFGHTLGNALRRVMLGYLSGAAVTKVKINGVQHEFSPIPGVHEDVVELVQNLKEIDFKVTRAKTHIVTLDATGEGEVKAGNLKCPTGIEVVNKDAHIATLSEKKSKLSLEITVEYSTGYRLPEVQEKKQIGVIPVDANFSPIVLVSYSVENARVGRETNLDKLVMDVTTNGSITPQEAIQQASAILLDYFELLAGDTKVYKEETEEDVSENPQKPETKVYLEELGLPTRVVNTLKKAGYETAEDIKAAGEAGLANVKNIGPKTVEMLIERVSGL